MDNGQSPVQPLDSSGGGSDARLANLLANAAGNATTPAANSGQAGSEVQRVAGGLCPNCLNGNGIETELEAENPELVATTGKCPTCGYDASLRIY